MKTFLAFVGLLLRIALMVVLELFAALLTYMYLAVYNRELFANLIRFADWVLSASVKPTLALFPSLEGQAYLTLVGELAPKAMLLLLIGLLVGAVFRLLAGLVTTLVMANTTRN